jgi:multidrug efflux pump subunit AcrA (membrane-fusion protein)
MKSLPLILIVSILLSGCARKFELEKARADLTEAQQKIAVLENERVPRSQYEQARASLKSADRQITELDQELKRTQQQLAVLEKAKQSVEAIAGQESRGAENPERLDLEKGAYERASETYVYSSDAQLNFGRHLQISSPTGLMVSDPEQKIIGGDLNIRAKDVMLETSDGLLTTSADGSVKFTGKTLTMKFEDKKPAPEALPDSMPLTNVNGASEATSTAPATTVTPAAANPQ